MYEYVVVIIDGCGEPSLIKVTATCMTAARNVAKAMFPNDTVARPWLVNEFQSYANDVVNSGVYVTEERPEDR